MTHIIARALGRDLTVEICRSTLIGCPLYPQISDLAVRTELYSIRQLRADGRIVSCLYIGTSG